MNMHNPPHPGEFIKEIYMDPFGLTGRQLAITLNVSPSTLNRILNGTSAITSEMAIRLSKAIGRSPESWLLMQDSYDLCVARKKVDLKSVKKIDFDALSA